MSARLPITNDAVEINSLVAWRPEKLLAVLERETLNGLWQLVLTDPERDKEWLLGRHMEWRLGYYIDGYENREVELRDELVRERHKEWLLGRPMEWWLSYWLSYYIDGYENREVEPRDELTKERRVDTGPDASPGEITWRGERMRIVVSGDIIRVEIGAWRLEYPLLCSPITRHPLAPVWLGTTREGRYFYLDCFSGFTVYPDSLEGLIGEVYRLRCSECGAMHWFEWRIVARGEIAVSSSEPPTGPNEVIEALRRALGVWESRRRPNKVIEALRRALRA
jgi:hypothetical protein